MIRLSLVLALALAACKGNSAPPAKPEPPTEEPKSEAPKEGVPCEQEIALECPDDQIDGCLKTPQEGDVHACVAK